jgi:hypothetical protein
MTGNLNCNADGHAEMNVSELATGMYLFTISAGGISAPAIRFIKE